MISTYNGLMFLKEGKGKMCQMLRDGETDIAVILTEGIVKDIVAGNQ
jgi:actin-like ATPase involved in cell morphogenesis